MALFDSYYRVKIDNVYSSAANATSVYNSINTYMSSIGRDERATLPTTTNVLLMIVGLTESEATSIRDGLKAAWTGATRTYGKVSVTRTNDLD